jgi:hypothetical protein
MTLQSIISRDERLHSLYVAATDKSCSCMTNCAAACMRSVLDTSALE